MPRKPARHSPAKNNRLHRHGERPSAASRGYGSRWKRLRIIYLKRHPICENPFGYDHHVVPATDIDHIISRRNGGPDSFQNLQALCHSCHSQKTRLEQTGKLKIIWEGEESVTKMKKFLRDFQMGRGGKISGTLKSETAGEVKRARQEKICYFHPGEGEDE